MRLILILAFSLVAASPTVMSVTQEFAPSAAQGNNSTAKCMMQLGLERPSRVQKGVSSVTPMDLSQYLQSLQRPKSRPKAHQRNTKGTPKAHQRHTTGRPRAHKRHTQGIPKAHQRHTKSTPKAHQRHTKGTPKAHQRHTRGTPKAHQKHTKGRPRAHQRHTKGTPKAHQRHTKSTPKAHQSHTKGTPRAHRKHTKGTTKAHQRHTKGTPKAHQRHTKGTPKEHQRHTKGAPKAHQRHAKGTPKQHQRHNKGTTKAHQRHTHTNTNTNTNTEGTPKAHQRQTEGGSNAHQSQQHPRSQTIQWFLLLMGAGAIASLITCIYKSFHHRPGVGIDVNTANLAETGDSGLEGRTSVLEPTLAISPMPPNSKLLDVLAGRPDDICLANTANDSSWTYAELREFIAAEAWVDFAKYRRVALVLPAGGELSAALLALIARTECAPLDASLSETETAAALKQLGAQAMLLCPASAPGAATAATRLGLTVYHLSQSTPEARALPRMYHSGTKLSSEDTNLWKAPPDVALVLRTSGTTGNSKVVPLRLGQIIDGARCIAASIDLQRSDVCLNAMPLFHIGGISCNLLATLVSGGAMVNLSTSFEPISFLGALSQRGPLQPTWYYASPSMHLAVASGEAKGGGARLRLVRSAAAAMPADLQVHLEKFFRCQVFATYGMTECMPVASPLHGQTFDGVRCQPLGSVGRSVGPSVEIHSGEVMLRGPLVMKGYEGSFSGLADEKFFPTGDLGHVDQEGFLWITGRKKEIINRGGETLAPQVLEEIAKAHEAVQDVAAYAVPHALLGESVGLAMILDSSAKSLSPKDLVVLADDIFARFSKNTQPAIVTFVADFPRTSTGKLQRLYLQMMLHDGGHRIELTGEERMPIVLDGRGGASDTGRSACACQHLTPEPGTVASIFEADSISDREPGQEQLDSLGVASLFSQRKSFQVKIVSYVYLIGVIGINARHTHHAFAGHLHPLVDSLFVFFGENTWHMAVFFACSGYIDGNHYPYLYARDALMLFVALCIPIFGRPMEYVTDFTQWGYDHPARWFFSWMLFSRLYVVVLREFRISVVVQIILSQPFAELLQFAFEKIHDSQGAVLRTLLFHAPLSDNMSSYKHGRMLTCYVVCFTLGPQLIDLAARNGPRTLAKQRFLGILCWTGFFGWNLIGKSYTERLDCAQNYPCDVDTALLPQVFLLLGTLKLTFLPSTAFLLLNILVLVAATALLPPSFIPQLACKSLLGGLFLIPIPMQAANAMTWFHQLYFASLGAFGQLLCLVAFLAVYTLVLAPIAQHLVITGMGAIPLPTGAKLAHTSTFKSL